MKIVAGQGVWKEEDRRRGDFLHLLVSFSLFVVFQAPGPTRMKKIAFWLACIFRIVDIDCKDVSHTF